MISSKRYRPTGFGSLEIFATTLPVTVFLYAFLFCRPEPDLIEERVSRPPEAVAPLSSETR